MSVDAVAWESFSWRVGAEVHRFEVRDNGLIGQLSMSGGRTLAMPVVAWEALLDAVKTNRKAKAKTELNLPPRAGARWTETEADQLVAKFKSGRSIDDLAREHARTSIAVEHQLTKRGLWDRTERRRVA
jgi:hypothetical protein